MSWLYQGVELESIPEGINSFVYKIDIGRNVYYGKKNFYVKRKKSFGKKKLAAITDKRLKTYETIVQESNWRNYASSSSMVQSLVKEGHSITRTILRLCSSLKEASYYENKYLYENIEKENCINENISGVFFKQEIVTKWQ